jgi:Ran GTPase-activating protein (RanGAP) involved in mRNA processing and transport
MRERTKLREQKEKGSVTSENLITSNKATTAYVKSLSYNPSELQIYFAAIASNTSLQKLVIGPNIIDEDSCVLLKSTLEANSSIRELSFQEVKFNSVDIGNSLVALYTNSRITTLTFYNVHFSANALLVLSESLPGCSSIRGLNFIEASLTSSGVNLLAQALYQMPNLTTLNLDLHSPGGSITTLVNYLPRTGTLAVSIHGACEGNDIEAIANAESEGMRFTALTLFHNNVISAPSAQALNRLTLSGYLTELVLNLSGVHEPTARAIGKALPEARTLFYLSLKQDFIGPNSGAETFFEGLGRNSNLYSLILSGNPDLEAIEHLSNALLSNSTLCILEMPSAQLVDTQIIKLLEGMKESPTIKVLSLPSIQIKDEGATALGEFLKTDTNLVWLAISLRQVTEAGCLQLLEGFKHNADIEYFQYLTNTNLGTRSKFYSAITDLKKQHPCLLKVVDTCDYAYIGTKNFTSTRGQQVKRDLDRILKYLDNPKFFKLLPHIKDYKYFAKMASHNSIFIGWIREGYKDTPTKQLTITNFLQKQQFTHPDHYFLLARICKDWKYAKYHDYKKPHYNKLSVVEKALSFATSPLLKVVDNLQELAVALVTHSEAPLTLEDIEAGGYELEVSPTPPSSLEEASLELVSEISPYSEVRYSNITMLNADVWGIIIGYAIE